MKRTFFKHMLFGLIGLLAVGAKSTAQTDLAEKRIMVALRMVAHEILLNSSDSTSRVLPIEKHDNRYKIQFEAAFHFVPENLVATIDSIIKKSNISENYLVEVQECNSGALVYSYEIDYAQKSEVVPCREREQPSGCYNLFVTLVSINPLLAEGVTSHPETLSNRENKQAASSRWVWLLIPIIFLAGWLLYKRQKATKNTLKRELIALGQFQFDKKNMQILHKKEVIDLTSKEADLLSLLHTHVNETIERDTILQAVWGDEGDYIGRTLDVFISKLRKKLEADAHVKIVNIRGIGYKLLTNS